MFEKYIIENKRSIIEKVCDLITYPSISEENTDNNYPFGKSCNDCLKYFLDLAKSLGFKVKNVDGMCGWAEFGEGDELIGIVGHLDVVPANEDDWSFSPFIPTIANNCIYGRGAIDDKGPVVVSLYAMKAIMEYYKEKNISINKRVRLIVGLNEEKDWKCIEYYKQHEEIPTIGFSPDSDFPCIYAEKSVVSLNISEGINNQITYPSNHITNTSYKIQKNIKTNSPTNCLFTIEEIDCGNNAINVVPKFCSIILTIEDPNMTNDFIITCKNIIEKYDYEIDLYKIDISHIKLTSYGVSAHSAHPELGVNSISKLIVVLNDVLKEFNVCFNIFTDFCNYIGDNYSGKCLNLDLKDESGMLTLNPSQFYIENGKINININLRVPVHTPPELVISTFKNKFRCEVNTLKIQPALYIDKDSQLVQKLCNVFNETCQTNFEPICIGGATYARAFPNCISFGMNFPGDNDMCHQADEFVQIDKLILASNIYAKAIYELMQ